MGTYTHDSTYYYKRLMIVYFMLPTSQWLDDMSELLSIQLHNVYLHVCNNVYTRSKSFIDEKNLECLGKIGFSLRYIAL